MATTKVNLIYDHTMMISANQMIYPLYNICHERHHEKLPNLEAIIIQFGNQFLIQLIQLTAIIWWLCIYRRLLYYQLVIINSFSNFLEKSWVNYTFSQWISNFDCTMFMTILVSVNLHLGVFSLQIPGALILGEKSLRRNNVFTKTRMLNWNTRQPGRYLWDQRIDSMVYYVLSSSSFRESPGELW